MFNVNVTVTASPELLDVLRKLTGAQGGQIPSLGAQNSPAPPNKMIAVPSSTPGAAAGTPAPDANLNASVTLEQVRALVTAKSQAGKMPEVKALLTSFGVNKVTELTADKYDAFYSEVNKIKVA